MVTSTRTPTVSQSDDAMEGLEVLTPHHLSIIPWYRLDFEFRMFPERKKFIQYLPAYGAWSKDTGTVNRSHMHSGLSVN